MPVNKHFKFVKPVIDAPVVSHFNYSVWAYSKNLKLLKLLYLFEIGAKQTAYPTGSLEVEDLSTLNTKGWQFYSNRSSHQK